MRPPATRLCGLAVLVPLVLGLAGASASAADDGFFFVHVSDVHAYRHASQVDQHYGLGPPWLPRVVAAFFALRGAERMLVPRYVPAVVAPMRTALGIASEDASYDLFDTWTYLDEVMRPGSALGHAEPALRAAFAEIHALRPAFIVNTGDIVFDSTKVPPAVSRDWAALLLEAAGSGPAPVHHTIGNHELGLTLREDASKSDPHYGPGFFHAHFGESPRAWSHGAFRFVALDTHSPDPEDPEWRVNRMRPEVRAWFAEELQRSQGQTVVVLNHEPFFADADWRVGEEFDQRQRVDDEGLLARHGVAYTLTGHIHLPGSTREGATTHIANGALSGMHWLLPPDAAPRGYRLFYARGGALFTVWKRSHAPAVGFLTPAASPGLFAVAPETVENDPTQVVAVAADAGGSFAQVTLEAAGELLPVERWGDYFLRASLPDGVDAAALELIATREDGTSVRVRGVAPAASSRGR